jgi:hypothetical protein
MYKCEILADSKNPQGDRITTMKITFPRFILAEFNTHRMFSRNSASSRAIPFKKMVQMVEENPFIPIAWQKDHKGMQGTEYFKPNEQHQGWFGDSRTNEVAFRAAWLEARNWAITAAMGFHKSDVTKQLCNRLLEPFMWHTVIVTASEFSNFFNLRCPQYLYDYEDSPIYFKSKKDWVNYYNGSQGYKEGNKEFTKVENLTDLEWLQINQSQADIHIQAIAELMWDTMNESTPKQLQAGEWHIPFGDNFDNDGGQFVQYLMKKWQNKQAPTDGNLWERIKIATARCARISYETLGDNPKIDYEADIKLHDILVQNGHASPLEHCAKAMSNDEYVSYFNGKSNENWDTDLVTDDTYEISAQFDNSKLGWCRNFKGFIQYRYLIENNNE